MCRGIYCRCRCNTDAFALAEISVDAIGGGVVKEFLSEREIKVA
jgi:hypothetical protein